MLNLGFITIRTRKEERVQEKLYSQRGLALSTYRDAYKHNLQVSTNVRHRYDGLKHTYELEHREYERLRKLYVELGLPQELQNYDTEKIAQAIQKSIMKQKLPKTEAQAANELTCEYCCRMFKTRTNVVKHQTTGKCKKGK